MKQMDFRLLKKEGCMCFRTKVCFLLVVCVCGCRVEYVDLHDSRYDFLSTTVKIIECRKSVDCLDEDKMHAFKEYCAVMNDILRAGKNIKFDDVLKSIGEPDLTGECVMGYMFTPAGDFGKMLTFRVRDGNVLKVYVADYIE